MRFRSGRAFGVSVSDTAFYLTAIRAAPEGWRRIPGEAVSRSKPRFSPVSRHFTARRENGHHNDRAAAAIVERVTAAEALILLEPDRAQGPLALMITLADLRARDALTLHSGNGNSRCVYLTPGSVRCAPANPHVAFLLRILRKMARFSPDGGVPLEALLQGIHALAGALNHADEEMGDYHRRFLCLPLMERGLLERCYSEALGLFPLMGCRLTAAGEAERQEWMLRLNLVRAAIQLSAHVPVEAALLLREAGDAALLLPDLRERLPALIALLQTSTTNGGKETDADFDLTRLHPNEWDCWAQAMSRLREEA